MDEPTAALGVTEAGQVIEVIKDQKHRGISVIFVSHRMEDICAVCDRVAYLLSRPTWRRAQKKGPVPERWSLGISSITK